MADRLVIREISSSRSFSSSYRLWTDRERGWVVVMSDSSFFGVSSDDQREGRPLATARGTESAGFRLVDQGPAVVLEQVARLLVTGGCRSNRHVQLLSQLAITLQNAVAPAQPG